MRLWLAPILVSVISFSLFGQSYTIDTLSGGGRPENIQGNTGAPGHVSGIAVDQAGNLFLLVGNTNVVLRWDATSAMLTRVAGTGTAGYSGDNGPAVKAQLSASLGGIAVDAGGNVFIADSGNQRVREVSPAGIITTVAGNGTRGFGGDSGPAIDAKLNTPQGLAVDAEGNLYIADAGNQRVRKVAGGVISTVAGTGTPGFSGDRGAATSAQLYNPLGVAVDATGRLYIADSSNNRVREVNGGVIDTLAGGGVALGDNGPAAAAQLNAPQSVTIEAAGNLYIADSGNHRVRKISGGTISTIAGNGNGTYSGDGGAGTAAGMKGPTAIAAASSGSVYLADSSDARVRVLTPAGANAVSASSPAAAAMTAKSVSPLSSGSLPQGVNPQGVVNGASFTPPVVPGSIATAFGSYAVSSPSSATGLPLTDSLDGLSLVFGDSSEKAPLFYVSSTQVNFQVPWDLAGQSQVNVAAVINGQSTTPQAMTLASYYPAIFTANAQGTGAATILDSNYKPIDANNPAVAGVTYVLIYCTGLGDVYNRPETGAAASGESLSTTKLTPTVTIGGAPSSAVSFSGLAPGFVGLYQVNAQVPAEAATGSAVPLTITVSGQVSNSVTIPVIAPSPSAQFGVLDVSHNSFSPGRATLGSSYPQMNVNGVAMDEVGWQDGALLNGWAVYYPYQIGVRGSTWIETINNSVPHGVMLAYNASGGFDNFNQPNNWIWNDLNTNLNWFSKGASQSGCLNGYVPPGNPNCNNIIGQEVGGIVVGSVVYMVPGAKASYPVLVKYDSSIGPINDNDAYETFTPPVEGTSMGKPYGWTEGCFDGRYVYYAPLADHIYGLSGNIFRYDTTLPFSNATSGGKTAAWANFDLTTVNPDATGFFDCQYDGHRFIYYTPFQNALVVRFDTWNGGLAADGTGFNMPSNYTIVDMTKLGTNGHPSVAGTGSAANLAGAVGGSRIVWDATNSQEYLYFIPWATFPNGAQDPILQSTAARLRIGTMSGSTWACTDFSSTQTSSMCPSSAGAEWQIYDLKDLQSNSAWPSNWAKVFPSTSFFAGQSTMGGFQLSWVNRVLPWPRIGFVANSGEFFVMHNVDHPLYDPSAWSVGGPRVTGAPPAAFGGAYDPARQLLYPSTPGLPLFVWKGL